MALKIFLLVLMIGTFNGCKETLTITTGNSPTSLQFTNDRNSTKVLFAPPTIPETLLAKEKEREIAKRCRVREVAEEFALPIAFLIGPAIDFIFDQMDKTLQNELEKYVATYNGSQNLRLYTKITADGPELGWQCFRFTRVTSEKRGEKEEQIVAMELTGEVQLTPERDALQFRPLRLYLGKGKAQGNKIGISVSIKAAAVWLQDNQGKSGTIFEEKLLSEEFDFSESPKAKYYLDKDWTNYKLLPVVPWSTNKKPAETGGAVTLTLDVAEVGAPPELLKTVASLFHKNKDSMSKTVKDAAEKLLKPQKT